ncbi:hypothetical protein C5S53_09105 [Methanophagales archaeon]|nr:hypothetical protein C5S53_09105 [Methanophagales archaeon]
MFLVKVFALERKSNRASGTANQIVLICRYSCNFSAFALKICLLPCQPNLKNISFNAIPKGFYTLYTMIKYRRGEKDDYN